MPWRASLVVLVFIAFGCKQLEPWNYVARKKDEPNKLPPIAKAEAPKPLNIPATTTPKNSDVQLVQNQAAPAKVDPASLRDRFAQTYAQMPSYSMRFRRREVIGNSKPREELILAKFRQVPYSVYMKWIGDEAKGREVTYVQGQYKNEIHTILAPGDIPFMAGKLFSVAPDSILLKEQSRYPITEAGLGPLLKRYSRSVADGTAQSIGKVNRPEFEQPLDAVLQTMPPQSDPMFPKGGRRTWHFDPATALPVLLITHDDQGREVEFYLHDRIQYPLQLDNDDFNPDKLWGKR